MARGELLVGEANVFDCRIGVALTTGITTYTRGLLYKFRWLLTNE